MQRRAFLSAVVATFLSACSRGGGQGAAPTTDPSTSPPTPDPTTSAPTTSAPTTRRPATSDATPTPEVETLAAPPADLPGDAFLLGIASGEPDDRSVVVWTRLTGAEAQTVTMVWEVATSSGFEHIVATGFVEAAAAHAHSVRVIVPGLEPATRYWYRFRAGDLVSATGRTRTMPSIGDTSPVALGISSCQNRESGAYAAHRDLAAADVDAVLWLGDYIYGEHRDLAEYRDAYASHRSDPALLACHAAHPWFVLIDDHEVSNDFDASVDPARRAAALQAWWEHQPTRLPPPDEQGHLRIHRSFDLGGSARLIGLDVRQYADGSHLLGDDQWAAVDAALLHSSARTLVASPVLMSGIRDLDGEPLLPYSIDAYPEERARMARALASAPDPLIVSGDLHTTLVADFSADPLDPGAPVVAVEIMAPAISSAFPEQYASLAPFLPLVNRQLREVEIANGWLRLDLDPESVAAEFHLVDDVADPRSPVTVRPVAL